MDNLVFEESINAEVEQSEFISKKWIYVNDTNSQNYSTQVIIDTTPLANSGGYVNWQEAYIIAPLVASLKVSGADVFLEADSEVLSKLLSTRAGFWHLINSMTVEFNNQTVVQQTPFLNVFRSFKAHTSFSQDDLKNEGSTLGYYPDESGTWEYQSPAASSSGIGICNNLTATGGNSSVAVRNAWISYTGKAKTGQETIQPVGDRASQYSATFAIYKDGVQVSGATAGNVLSWRFYAKLRLKDLADYFNKTPLLKGSTIRLLINTNQLTSQAIACSNLTAPVFTISSTVAQGYTNPLMLSASACAGDVAGGGKVGDLIKNKTITISCNIYNDIANNVKTPLSSTRLYAPVYKMNPIAEQRYLSLAPTKKVSYRDVFQYQFSAPPGQFNFLVSNGIPNIKSVTVVPFLSTGDNGGISPMLSPYSTAGATPDPLILNNFNILVSGVNLFLQNQLYSYEQFNHELKSSNQLNGSLTTGLASGLISEQDFVNLYRYYYGNCARILPSEEGVSRSVQIIGELKGTKNATLMVFVEFEKTMTIDISTGARID